METVPAEFAIALRTARLIRAMTLGQIAAGTGVPTWRLSSFERGIDVPSPTEFASVWRFLTSGRENDAEQVTRRQQALAPPPTREAG